MAELAKLGARTVPVIARGDQWINGQVINDIIGFLDLGARQQPKLSPAQLIERLDVILQAAQRYTRQFSREQLALKLRNRDRSYRVLLHHIFRIPQAFVESAEADSELQYNSLVAPPPDHLQSGAAIADYGNEVRQQLQQWWQHLDDRDCRGNIDTYYGRQTLPEMLERTTWHSGQHVRQVMTLLDDLGIEPDERLDAGAFADLPLPEKVWDD
jgi:hypothetical protein